ncbi:MAG: AMP-binding protein [Burkholderiaceae bacterium]|nr:AMP-binding protein [Burkholderiaceae bacterium]
MSGEAFDLQAHARAMRERGYWTDVTLDQLLARAIEKSPNKRALVAYRADAPGDEPVLSLTYAELGERVARVAGSLRAMGVGAGDFVAVQLPNWWEFVVVSLACGRIGAIVNPLMPIFRERELGFMLGFCDAKVFVVPDTFRGFDFASMARGLQQSLPKLEQVVVVGGTGPDSFEALLSKGDGSTVPYGDSASLKGDDLAVLMFTSGTTGEPKGVMHLCNTMVACTNALANRFHLADDAVLLCCSPMGHMTGYAAVMVQSLHLGGTLILQDVWDPQRGVRIMAEEGVTHTAASTPFLADICNAVAAGAPRPALRTFLCGGAPIPSMLIDRAAAELDLHVSSLWGMTEALAGTLTEPERAAEKSSSTDGRAVDGVEVRVVDDAGRPLPAGETGRLMVRGAQMFVGYYKRPEFPSFDAQGWFDTGDLAYADDEGYIRINGRTKDVLIRGGENVPVFEIENLLYKHPAVVDAALVGYPDARLGERGCAFVTLKPEAALDFAGVQAWMAENKVARQYWPEHLEVIDAMPRTASGKIQKFVLRERAKAFGSADGTNRA